MDDDTIKKMNVDDPGASEKAVRHPRVLLQKTKIKRRNKFQKKIRLKIKKKCNRDKRGCHQSGTNRRH